jgi:hypothetical protein
MGCCPVKAQAAIGFGKVVVGTYLNRTVTFVLNHQCASSAANVESMLALINEEFSGGHGLAFKPG